MSRPTLFFVAASFVAVAACSDDTSSSTSVSPTETPDGSRQSASCSTVCDRLVERCGPAPGDCASTVCGGLAEAQRACVVDAASCADAQACLQSSGTGAPPGSGGGATTPAADLKDCSPPKAASTCGGGCTRADIGGVAFCTVACDGDAMCALRLGAGYTCFATACRPTCSSNTDCTKRGLTRCLFPGGDTSQLGTCS